MKKFTIVLASALLLATSAFAEFRIGLSAAMTKIETDGSETLKSSGNKTNKSVEETVAVASGFIEIANSNGFAVGIDYIPGEEQLGKGTGDDDDDETSGANTASADIESVTTIYALVPMGSSSIYGKLGYSQADIITTESLSTGTTYGNTSVDGILIGLGVAKELNNGFSFRAEATYTGYDDISLTGSADADSVSNKIDADIDATAFRLSIVKAF